VKLTVRFRGREIVHADRGRAQLDAIASALGDVAVVVVPPALEARAMSLVLAPA
jgi:translation initiation factor IF-3